MAVGVMGDLSGVMPVGVLHVLIASDSIGLLAVVVVVGCGTGAMLRESFGFIALEANILIRGLICLLCVLES